MDVSDNQLIILDSCRLVDWPTISLFLQKPVVHSLLFIAFVKGIELNRSNEGQWYWWQFLSIRWLEHGWPGGFSMVDLWAFFRVGGACLIGYYVYHAYMALKHDPNGDGIVDARQQIQVSVTGWNFKCHLWYEISHMCFKHLWSRIFEAEINDLWFDTFCFFAGVVDCCEHLPTVTVPITCNCLCLCLCIITCNCSSFLFHDSC